MGARVDTLRRAARHRHDLRGAARIAMARAVLRWATTRVPLCGPTTRVALRERLPG